jgi:hypothetical protein
LLTPLLRDLGFRIDPNQQEAPLFRIEGSMLTPLLLDLGFRIDPNLQEGIESIACSPHSSRFRFRIDPNLQEARLFRIEGSMLTPLFRI